MINRKRQRRQTRHQIRNQNTGHISKNNSDRFRRQRNFRVLMPVQKTVKTSGKTFIKGNQSGNRCKRHLKTGAYQRLRRNNQHNQRRPRNHTHGNRLTRKQNPEQHDKCHDKCPLTGNFRTGNHQINRTHQNRENRRSLFGIITQCQRRNQHQQQTHQKKHQTGQHTHMQPGYRKKMRQSGISVIFGNLLSYAAPVAGNDGRGNSGLIGRQNRIDFGHDPAAQIRRGFFQHGSKRRFF